MAKKEIEVIDMGGAKTVAKKKSFVTMVKSTMLVFTIVWFAFAAVAPLYVKKHYGDQIKKSIVVSMFFDLKDPLQKQSLMASHIYCQ